MTKMIDQTKHLRESRHILTQMEVLYFNIENAVFAAELKCPDEFRCEGGSECKFKKNGECIIPKIRELVGESGGFWLSATGIKGKAILTNWFNCPILNKKFLLW